MALKIRLRQQGRTNRLTYRLILADSKSPRDGKYVEMLGWYCPCESKGNTLHVEADRVEFWLDQGAQLSEKAESLVKQAAPSVMKTYKDRLKKRDEKLRDKRKAARKKAVEKKAATAKPAAKKTAAKPAAKKAPAKKPAAKKPAAKKAAEKKDA
ncbi:MAG: hypothetical protein S4CHLAM37_11240 [Chlamydiia bacterium]|nr:hypothetical protein [Chlamydiia bacterium]